MRRLGRRVHARVFINTNHGRLHMHIADDVFELTPGEAISLADQLVDQTENLKKGSTA